MIGTRVAVLACILGLSGCAGQQLHIDTRYESVAQSSRVQVLVLHYTVGDFESAVRILTEGEVSSHYLVDDYPPRIYRLVEEDRLARHAGASHWLGDTVLNPASIGIEIVNAGHGGDRFGDYAPYPDAQVELVVRLVRDIARRHGIAPHNILGHADIAPQRKEDPGPRFPWQRLADEGLIPWPDRQFVAQRAAEYATALPDVAWFQAQLDAWGFEVPRHGEFDEETRHVISAFQMKYRPSRYDGEPDAETAGLLEAVNSPRALLIRRDGQWQPYR